jgi:hypothetical protein
LLRDQPQRVWYEARAAAESVKTLSWRYSVGGEPFNIGTVSGEDTERLFLQELDGVIAVLRDLNLPLHSFTGDQITEPMRRLRTNNLEERKRVYEHDRVAQQQEWYGRKAKWNSRRASQWTIAMLVIEIAGVVAAIMKATGILEGDLLIFMGAVLAAVSAWLQTKQHETLATAYSITVVELASLRTKIKLQSKEEDWAKFVSEAEEAFSREHTLWKASRGVRSI